MAHRRISVTVDTALEDILTRNKQKGESDGGCIARVAKQMDSIAKQMEIMNLRADRTHDETKRLLTDFLQNVRKPFEQINENLEAINEKIGNRK